MDPQLTQGLLNFQENASASKQAAVESDEEARRRRRELAVKALKKSLQEGERGENRTSTATVEQSRLPANSQVAQDTVDTVGQAVKPQTSQKEQAASSAQPAAVDHATASRGGQRYPICLEIVLKGMLLYYVLICDSVPLVSFLLGCRQNTTNFGSNDMKRQKGHDATRHKVTPWKEVNSKDGNEKPARVFPGKEEVVYDDI